MGVVSILVVLDDALVRKVSAAVVWCRKVSILVVLDDALVHGETFINEISGEESQSLLCWTML